MIKQIIEKMIADVKAGYSAESSAKDIFNYLTNIGFTDSGASKIIKTTMKVVINN